MLHSVAIGKIFIDCGTGTKIPLVMDELIKSDILVMFLLQSLLGCLYEHVSCIVTMKLCHLIYCIEHTL